MVLYSFRHFVEQVVGMAGNARRKVDGKRRRADFLLTFDCVKKKGWGCVCGRSCSESCRDFRGLAFCVSFC